MRHLPLVLAFALLLPGCAAGADLTVLGGGAPLTTFGGGFGGLKGTAPSQPGAAAPAGAAATAPLSAGSVDDNLGFDAFLAYLARYKGEPMRELDVSERHVIRVVDAAGKSVPSAELFVQEGADTRYQARTFADGRQLFHPRVAGAAGRAFTVRATKDGMSGAATFDAQHQGDWVVTLDGQAAAPKRDLQVLFMLDATGSMGGEIGQLQETIKTIAKRVADTGSTASYGLVAYRDRGDDWVVKKKDFTTDVAAFAKTLSGIEADSGGDYPEDMEAGLATATKELSWSEGDATRLTFLIADAPPHVDYEGGVPYTRSALNAACKGVKIFGVGCSGLEAEGEYALRQLSQFTMAKYMFLTRGGDSDRGGGKVSHDVADFKETRLDDMIVDTVKAELGSLGK